jgi:hypothetical protein
MGAGQPVDRIAECRACTRPGKWLCDLHARLPPDYDEAKDYGIYFRSEADGDWLIIKEGTDMAKKYRVEVSVKSFTDGELDQAHTVTEESADLDVHMHKAFALNAAVTAACTQAMVEMAGEAAKARAKK